MLKGFLHDFVLFHFRPILGSVWGPLVGGTLPGRKKVHFGPLFQKGQHRARQTFQKLISGIATNRHPQNPPRQGATGISNGIPSGRMLIFVSGGRFQNLDLISHLSGPDRCEFQVQIPASMQVKSVLCHGKGLMVKF